MQEAILTVETGESSPARNGRTAFRRNFAGTFAWRGRTYENRQTNVIAVEDTEREEWVIITAVIKYF